MTNKIEIRTSTVENIGYREWTNKIEGLSEQERKLLEIGYRLFFDRVLALPIERKSKHQSDYVESDLNVVDITDDDLGVLDGEEMKSLRQIQDITGFWPPYKIGVFGVDDNRSESSRSEHSQSAELVVKSLYGGVFKRQTVISVNQEFNVNSGYHKGGIGISFGSARNKCREIELLQVANTLVNIYSKKLS